MEMKERGQGDRDRLFAEKRGELRRGGVALLFFPEARFLSFLVDLRLCAYFVGFAYFIPYINPVFCCLDLFAFAAHPSVYVDPQGCGRWEGFRTVWAY